jgi:hypothetical protein
MKYYNIKTLAHISTGQYDHARCQSELVEDCGRENNSFFEQKLNSFYKKSKIFLWNYKTLYISLSKT